MLKSKLYVEINRSWRPSPASTGRARSWAPGCGAQVELGPVINNNAETDAAGSNSRDNESFDSFHPAAGRHVPVHGRHHARRARRLSFLAAVRAAQVDFPTIEVQTIYPGASPEVMSQTVTAPLERQLGQMPGLIRMSSTSAAGASIVTLQFGLELTLDVAEQEVQAAINASGSLLPTDFPRRPCTRR